MLRGVEQFARDDCKSSELATDPNSDLSRKKNEQPLRYTALGQCLSKLLKTQIPGGVAPTESKSPGEGCVFNSVTSSFDPPRLGNSQLAAYIQETLPPILDKSSNSKW